VLHERVDLTPTTDSVRRALAYLSDLGWVELEDREGLAVVRISPDGIDELEAMPDYRDRFQNYRRLRYYTLLALSKQPRSRPMGVQMIRHIVEQHPELRPTDRELKGAITYLHGRGLAEWVDRDIAKIKAAGTDFLFGRGRLVAGVLSPVQLR
jgi:hypothetical protein